MGWQGATDPSDSSNLFLVCHGKEQQRSLVVLVMAQHLSTSFTGYIQKAVLQLTHSWVALVSPMFPVKPSAVRRQKWQSACCAIGHAPMTDPFLGIFDPAALSDMVRNTCI